MDNRAQLASLLEDHSNGTAQLNGADKGFIHNYLKNLSHFKQLGTVVQGAKPNNGSINQSLREYKSTKERVIHPRMFPDNSKSFGFQGINYPKKKVLQEYEYASLQDKLVKYKTINGRDGMLDAEAAQKEWDYPQCWDTCDFCQDHGVLDC